MSALNPRKKVAVEIPNNVPTTYSNVPWYLGGGKDESLQHQKAPPKPAETLGSGIVKTRIREETKWRPGACDNCGAMTHKTKECIEPPRKIPAKYSNKEIRAGEVASSTLMSYEAKRDRFASVDSAKLSALVASAHSKKVEVMKGHENLTLSTEAETRETMSDLQRVAQGARASFLIGTEMPVYLKQGCIQYDPKTHSARGSVFAEESAETREQNASRLEFLERSQFAHRQSSSGSAIHFVGTPTEAEYAFRKHFEDKALEATAKGMIMKEKYKPPPGYGVVNPVSSISDSAVVGLTPEVSRYDEDVFVRGHTSIWGSLWTVEKGWGYKCCGLHDKESFCASEEEYAPS